MRYLLIICLLAAAPLGAQRLFADVSEMAGVGRPGRSRGVSICDYNNDGRPDIFVCRLDGPNLLYRNDGELSFTEVGHQTPLAEAGNSMTALWADLDNDGDQDVVIGNKAQASRIYEQHAPGSFREITAAAGLQLNERVQSGVIFDFDGDGLLDIYLACLNAPNQLYHNQGKLQFQLMGADAGAAQEGLAMGTLAFDYDLDGDQDLYLVHDGNQPNTLLRNDGGRFTDVSRESGTDLVGDGMGIDAADFDGDGDFDLYVTNLYENFLLENRGDGTFRDIAYDARVNDLGMGWGTAWLDYDNDSRPDLYIANETGFTIAGKRYNNILYHNEGDLTFTEAAPADDEICSPYGAYGTAVADFDGDGRQDLFVANSGNDGDQLFQNVSPTDNNWIGFTLESTTANRDAIGAKIKIYPGGEAQLAEVRTGGSFASQHTRRLHFGLSDVGVLDSVVVHWPLGNRTSYQGNDFAVNAYYHITEEAASSIRETKTVEISLYPNPTAGELNWSERLSDPKIYDTFGRQVASFTGARTSLTIPGSLPAGMYHLVGRGEQGLRRASFVYRPTP